MLDMRGGVSFFRSDGFSAQPGDPVDTAREEGRSIAQQHDLAMHLKTLPDWNCCGSSSVHAVRPQLAVSLAARNLFQAQALGMDLMVMCAGCSNRLRVASNQLQHDAKTREINHLLLNQPVERRPARKPSAGFASEKIEATPMEKCRIPSPCRVEICALLWLSACLPP